MNHYAKRFSTVLVAVAFLTGLAASAPKESGETRPLDKQLLKQLNVGADELDRELFGPDEKQAKPPEQPAKQAAPPGRKADRPPGQHLDAASISEDENPLVDIARRMREAERLIEQSESGAKTQELQGRILADLDELLKKTCQQCAGASGEPKKDGKDKGVIDRKMTVDTKRNTSPVRTPKGLNPTRVAKERQTTNRKTKPAPSEVREMMQALWGLLPEREREQMMQLAAPEEFLPKYEALIEEYFRRLAEDKEK